MDVPQVKTVYMDIYDCRSEYDFYNRFASAILKSTGNRAEQILENIKRFLVRLSPKFSFSPEPNSEFSLSLGITPKDYTPEEILNLPELIAREKGFRIVVCIDEFQQVGEFPGSVEEAEELVKTWETALKQVDINDTELVNNATKRLEDAKKELQRRKITVGLEVKADITVGSPKWLDSVEK